MHKVQQRVANQRVSIIPTQSAAPSRNQSSANLGAANAFPELPKAKKPTSTVFSPGYTGSGVIRTNSNFSGVNAWQPGGSASNGAPTPIETGAENETSTCGSTCYSSLTFLYRFRVEPVSAIERRGMSVVRQVAPNTSIRIRSG